MTLREVSEQSSVSLFTASRALSGHAGVADETRRHVQSVAKRIGYVPNQHARNLKGTQSHFIGIIAASKANGYYATLVASIEEAVGTRGYSCFVADAAPNGIYSPDQEDRIVQSLIQQRVAGVVVTCVVSDQNLELLRNWDIPVLFVDCLPPPAHALLPSVTTDNFNGSWAIGSHLAALGYRRWCFVGHARTWNTREPRQRGFEAAARACGAKMRVVEGGNDPEVARRGVTALLAELSPAERPQAIYASNTVLLRGTLQALADCAIELPGGMAVVAFDDFDWAAMIRPAITVVDQVIGLVGRTAGSRLLALLDANGRAGSDALVIAPRLLVRESCGAKLEAARRPGARAASPSPATDTQQERGAAE